MSTRLSEDTEKGIRKDEPFNTPRLDQLKLSIANTLPTPMPTMSMGIAQMTQMGFNPETLRLMTLLMNSQNNRLPLTPSSSSSSSSATPSELPSPSPEVREELARRVSLVKSSTIKLRLRNSDIWKLFDEHGNEMLIQNCGRRMFPPLDVAITGHSPYKIYCCGVLLTVEAARQLFDPVTQKWFSRSSGNYPSYNETNEVFLSSNTADLHSDSLFDLSGLKIYNVGMPVKKKVYSTEKKRPAKEANTENMIKVDSLHKYRPLIRIYEMDETGNKILVHEQFFPETSFVTVSGYKSVKVNELKRNLNKFSRDTFKTDGFKKFKFSRQ